MKKSIKVGLGVVVVLAAIQFIRPARNESSQPPGPDDLTVMHPPSAAVRATLVHACLDCHSDHTRYPWYFNIEPVGWWLADHISEARHHLNFSTFGRLPRKRQLRKLHGVIELVTKGKMPIASYKLLHPDARLSPKEAKALADWARAARKQIEHS